MPIPRTTLIATASLVLPSLLLGITLAASDVDAPVRGTGTPTQLVMAVPATEVEPAPARAVDASLTAAERELVRWATSRFELIGFDLPDVVISFHEDKTPCGGHDGRFVRSDGVGEIRICVPDHGSFAFDLQRRRTLIHEFAHAWDAANLDDTDREALLGVVDAESWTARAAEWDRRGAERFAETVVWGLYDQRRRPVLLDDVSCAELHADFIRITGSSALGTIEPNCRPPTDGAAVVRTIQTESGANGRAGAIKAIVSRADVR